VLDAAAALGLGGGPDRMWSSREEPPLGGAFLAGASAGGRS
jgi:hypothetical protein